MNNADKIKRKNIKMNNADKIKLQNELTASFLHIFEPFIKQGYSLDELRGAAGESLFSFKLADKLSDPFLPDPQDWKYDYNLSHIQNIKNYRQVFKCSLIVAKESLAGFNWVLK